MVKTYEKKPVQIEALQWDGQNYEEVSDFLEEAVNGSIIHSSQTPEVFINTLEGIMNAKVGDFIIKGVKGEFYPCDEEIFHLTYKEV